MHIGVIGIRSKHLNFFRKALAFCFPGGEHTITHICGYDAPELLAQHGDLCLCPTPESLIASVDAVIIALREGYQHAALAECCIKEKKPVFVDKPFTCDPQEAEYLCDLVRQSGVPCTGGSTVCLIPEVEGLRADLPACAEYTLSYMADPFSPFGGWYFYGSHMTDLCVTLFGTGWQKVSARIEGSRVSATVVYPEFQVHIRTSPEAQPLLVRADQDYVLDDQHCYEAGMRHFIAVAEGRVPGRADVLAAATRLLDEIVSALRG